MMKPQKVPANALAYFMHAKRFAQADNYIRRAEDVALTNIIALPSLVLSAFASELYFKSLHIIEYGTAPKGHNLKNLHRNLSGPTRKKIEMRWTQYIGRMEYIIAITERESGEKIPRDFDSMLSLGGRAFEELRYPGEHSSTGFFLADLPRLLEETIFEFKPEWQRIRHAPPKPLDPQKPAPNGR